MRRRSRYRYAPLAALALTVGLLGGTALAQAPYKIGISGAATGPASPSYLPHIEAIRLYVRQLNDKGGIAGSRIDVIFLDDKAAPSEAASTAKRLMDDEQVLAVGLMSLSSTYAPMFQPPRERRRRCCFSARRCVRGMPPLRR